MSAEVAAASVQGTVGLPLDFSPFIARTTAVHSAIAPLAYDCVKLIFVRAGEATLLSEFGSRRVVPGDVAMLAANTLCGSRPVDSITVTTLYIDHDYLVDHVFWQYASILTCRLEARDIVDAVYAEPAQVLRLGVERAGQVLPWLDEMVALSVGGVQPERFYRMQALLFAVIDIIAPHVKITTARESPTQRRTACPTIPRHRQFVPLRSEARQAAELLRDTPERRWTLADLANAVHLSPSQLGRVFVDAFGKTPIAYLTMVRTERMAALLRQTDETIAGVARRAGWGDPDYAARQFRRSIGLTPRQYRELRIRDVVAG
ncbi:helix-turn-helix transcriptional regulator [Amycolatopsis sacchari]|uniref:helix-turn-helix transcriptional regulator n=1 Tax=Amycolatopsis sacchari TaxID=115433 RepID=UPI003EBC8A0A